MYGTFAEDNDRIKSLVPWKEVQQFNGNLTRKWGGIYIVVDCKKQKLPKNKRFMLSVNATDHTLSSEDAYIACKIWKCPPTAGLIEQGAMLVLSAQSALLRQFNGVFQLHVNYDNIQIVAPHEINEYHTSSSCIVSSPKNNVLSSLTKTVPSECTETIISIDAIRGMNSSTASESIVSHENKKRNFSQIDCEEDVDNDADDGSVQQKQPKKCKPETVVSSPLKKQIETNRELAIQKQSVWQYHADKIYVVDIETTSFPPNPVGVEHGDVIVEIGIVQYNRSTRQIQPVLQCFIDVESYDEYPAQWRQSWIFKQNPNMLAMVEQFGISSKIVLPQIRRILNQQNGCATSYGFDFDFTRFLQRPPYNCDIKPFSCIMHLCGKSMHIRKPALKDAAFDILGMDYHRSVSYHNAMEDCLTAAKILAKLI